MRSLLFILLSIIASANIAKPTDSLTVKVINGKRFIVHKVDAGQTAMAVTRRYNVTLSELAKHNPHIDINKVKKGELVYVPLYDTLIAIIPVNNGGTVDRLATHANADATERISGSGRHLVQPGETLSRIAQKYKVSIADLTRWNNIREGRIDAGQLLTVSQAASILPYKPWNKSDGIIPASETVLSNDGITEQYMNIQIVKGNSISMNKLLRNAFVTLHFTEDSVYKMIEISEVNPTLNNGNLAIGEELLKQWGITHTDQRVIIKYVE
jgi:LysM repeat protein